ncbi:peptidoglycan DD-metalloendopeptidase family protein [Teredinibacter purpureus]|uniref:peptidoglycan DD-metalloendopeptidase family protein n=1 Tax=Teredinibacter purpureus TaxID=2731756 RepID=UPI000AEB45AC|nr:peptidoglycan DD-metalloendopeptidase family protein [Teredinibacter purpureus]
MITVSMLGLLVSACSSGGSRANVTDLISPEDQRLKFHIVAKGETLYSIAWRYNLDYKVLARMNGVGSSYKIYPGQTISLLVGASNVASNPAVPPAPKPARPSTKPVSSSPVIRSIKTPPVAPKDTKKTPSKNPEKWQWPSQGKIIATFSSNGGLNKGIDIKGKLGEPVYSSAAGIVVYSGSGLRGYGKLLIVKHSDKYLSAYAHNHRLLVKDGDQVTTGEKIAEMGSTGTDGVKLHFEIRYDGNPVDPLRFLPRI